MTERERIGLLREGYIRRMQEELRGPLAPEFMQQSAERAYPMPKVKRPRVVRIDDTEYRVVDGQVQYRLAEYFGWTNASVLRADKIRALADLLDNPDEEVECE